jgi:hypothetical protein
VLAGALFLILFVFVGAILIRRRRPPPPSYSVGSIRPQLESLYNSFAETPAFFVDLVTVGQAIRPIPYPATLGEHLNGQFCHDNSVTAVGSIGKREVSSQSGRSKMPTVGKDGESRPRKQLKCKEKPEA